MPRNLQNLLKNIKNSPLYSKIFVDLYKNSKFIKNSLLHGTKEL